MVKTGWTGYYDCITHSAFKCPAKLKVFKVKSNTEVEYGKNEHTDRCSSAKVTIEDMKIIHAKPEMELLLKTYTHDLTTSSPMDIAIQVRQEIEEKYSGLTT